MGKVPAGRWGSLVASKRSAEFPGFYGVLDIGETEPLSKLERQALRDDVDAVASHAISPNDFVAEIIELTERLRDLQKLDRERTRASRIAEADAAIQVLQRGDKLPKLSQIGTRDLGRLRERFPGARDEELLSRLKAEIPKSRSGRAPDDALHTTAVMLAELYREHMGKEPCCADDGAFVELLQAVAKAADGKVRTALHAMARLAIKARPIADSDGVRWISRHRP